MRTGLLCALLLLLPLTADAGPKVKLTLGQARKIALAKVPGTIVEEELEKERGVWVYEFEIKPDPKKKTLKEVVIDANSGKVLEIETENEDDDKEGDDDDGRDDD